MAQNKILGYKKMFGFVLPDWVDEKVVRTIAFALLSLVVMLMVLILLIWPNMAVVKTKNTELVAAKESLALITTSKQGVDRLQTDLSRKDQDAILTAIPTQYSPETAIYMLRSISNDSGVSIVSYSLPDVTLLDSSPVKTLTKTKEMVSFTAFPIRVEVSAQISALIKFIAKLESSLPLSIVSDLNLQEVTKLSSIGTDKSVHLSLEVMFYQSNLASVNLNKMEQLTETEIALAKDLSRYNMLAISEPNVGLESTPAALENTKVFGF